jgi:hypothetical protein
MKLAISTARWTATAALVVLSANCASLHANSLAQPEGAWPSALAAAQTRAAEDSFDAADSTLAGFALRFPGTPEALETTYWRAIYRMDPTNPHVSLPAALASLDGYLADKRPRAHVLEAATLRRVAGQLDSMKSLAATALAQAKDATITAKDAKAQAADARAEAAKAAEAALPAPDVEIKRLKDELAKANAELERIRRRLAQPPPKPPAY